MNTFEFQASTKILFEADSVRHLGAEVQALGAKRVLVVSDRGIATAGLLEPVKMSLHSYGIDFEVFDEVEPNPTDQTLLQGAHCSKRGGAEVVVGVGGGSPMDAAKGIAVMAVNEGPVEGYCGAGVDPWPVEPLPVVAIPTTAGTGAEVSAAAMINLPHLKRKSDLFGPSILPKTAILDPMLTVGLPPHLTAWTGLDALSHAVEAYVCSHANPISDAIAEHAIRIVADYLRRAYEDGEDIEARGNMLIASAMAVIAASNAGGLGVIHSLAQTLGGFYNLPHGLTIALSFAKGLAYNAPAVPEKYAKFADLMGVDTSGMTTGEAAQAGIAAIQALTADVGIAENLQSLGVQRDDIPHLSELAMLDGCTPPNPKPLQVDDFVAIYESMFDED
ncbi:MAG: iron-containing alcohol dehydrogenase [Proteobacteria bacterium]|nr:iron-containing alcohol dehydrogenase [Pseudomonadota bacterium]